MTASTEAATNPRLTVIYDRAGAERQRDNYARADDARTRQTVWQEWDDDVFEVPR